MANHFTVFLTERDSKKEFLYFENFVFFLGKLGDFLRINVIFFLKTQLKDLKDLQVEVESWRELAVNLNKKVEEIYDQMRGKIGVIEGYFHDWVKQLRQSWK